MTAILLAGRTGQVGWELERALAGVGCVVATGRGQLDLTDPDSIRAAIRQAKPDIIVSAAGYTNVDEAEGEPELAMRVNGVAPGIMAEEAKRLGALLVHYSTEYVYDGTLGRPYTEEDAPNPVNVYGRTKLAGDRAIQATGCAHLILRTSWVYGARGRNFVLTILKLAREKAELPVVADQTGSPTWARKLAEGTASLLSQLEAARANSGIFHFAAAGHATRYEFAHAVVGKMRQLTGQAAGWAEVQPIRSAQYPLPAARPHGLVTSKDKLARLFGLAMPDWRDELAAFLAELAANPEWKSRLLAGT
jgi:dTDP-4-dehydrorhamnose reductase